MGQADGMQNSFEVVRTAMGQAACNYQYVMAKAQNDQNCKMIYTKTWTSNKYFVRIQNATNIVISIAKKVKCQNTLSFAQWRSGVPSVPLPSCFRVGPAKSRNPRNPRNPIFGSD